MVIHEIQIKITQQVGQLIFFSNFSQKRIKILNKVINVRVWWSVDDTNNYIFDRGWRISMNKDSVEGDDMSVIAKSGRIIKSGSLSTQGCCD